MTSSLLIALLASGVAVIVLGGRAGRRAKRALRRVTDAEFCDGKPDDVPESAWFAARACMARSLDLDPAQIDPRQRVAALLKPFSVLFGAPALDIQDVFEDCCADSQREAFVGAVERDDASLGDLLRIVARRKA